MIILGIETATAVCGVAVVRDGHVESEQIVESPQVHSEKLVPLIEQVVRESGIRPSDLDAIAVSIGPGSFTGLRIGLSVAKGLCFALGKPVVPVPTLEALAHRVANGSPEFLGGYILPLLDARRGDCYASLYRLDGAMPVEVEPVRAVRLSALREFLGGRMPVTICGEGESLLRNDPVTGTMPGVRFAPPALSSCHPAAVAGVGGRMFAAGRTADLSTLEPLYVREFFTTVQQHHTIPE
jgi:tRNA threonylcarbamoyladenosine biosynthesis protein TsaB